MSSCKRVDCALGRALVREPRAARDIARLWPHVRGCGACQAAYDQVLGLLKESAAVELQAEIGRLRVAVARDSSSKSRMAFRLVVIGVPVAATAVAALLVFSAGNSLEPTKEPSAHSFGTRESDSNKAFGVRAFCAASDNLEFRPAKAIGERLCAPGERLFFAYRAHRPGFVSVFGRRGAAVELVSEARRIEASTDLRSLEPVPDAIKYSSLIFVYTKEEPDSAATLAVRAALETRLENEIEKELEVEVVEWKL